MYEPRSFNRLVYVFGLTAIVALIISFSLLIASFANGQEQPIPAGKFNNEVDWAEVQRWGDRVTISGEGPRAGSEMMYSQAMAPPALDDDQWFITLWGTSTDASSKQWLSAFERDPNLTPFIADPPPEAKRKAWAHFNYYKSDDPTQGWRFKDFKIDDPNDLPIATIQAPRNGKFGKPTVIIDRINLKQVGGPAGFKKRLSDTVTLWCRKLQQSGFQPPITPVNNYDPNTPAAFFSSGSRQQSQGVIGGGNGQWGPPQQSYGGTTAPWGPAFPPPNQPISPLFPAGGPAGVDISSLGGDGFFFHLMWVGVVILICLFIFQLKPNVAAFFQKKVDPRLALLEAAIVKMSSGTVTTNPTPPPVQVVPTQFPTGATLVPNGAGGFSIVTPPTQPNPPVLNVTN